jgi:hypothetical protein
VNLVFISFNVRGDRNFKFPTRKLNTNLSCCRLKVKQFLFSSGACPTRKPKNRPASCICMRSNRCKVHSLAFGLCVSGRVADLGQEAWLHGTQSVQPDKNFLTGPKIRSPAPSSDGSDKKCSAFSATSLGKPCQR